MFLYESRYRNSLTILINNLQLRRISRLLPPGGSLARLDRPPQGGFSRRHRRTYLT